jgi:hypothetical protein
LSGAKTNFSIEGKVNFNDLVNPKKQIATRTFLMKLWFKLHDVTITSPWRHRDFIAILVRADG